jgi:hypothetical protein
MFAPALRFRVTESLFGRQSLTMGGNMAESSSSSVASVAIVVIILLAISAFYFLFVRGVHAQRDINIDIKGPSQDMPVDKR